MRTRHRRWLLALSALLMTAGCEIELAGQPDTGAIEVSAEDTVNGSAITGAELLLDGVPQGVTTPATLEDVPAGEHELEVRPGGLYPARSRQVRVTALETTRQHFRFAPAETLATVHITSNVAAAVMLDERPLDGPQTPRTVTLSPGEHTVSLFRPGYVTAAPALAQVDPAAGESDTLIFQLDSLAAGVDRGQLAPDVELVTDGGDTLRLAQFRGRAVLLSFWFYSCTPCREEFPLIEQIWRDRASEGFRVMAINTGWTSDAGEEFEAIRNELGLSFPLLYPQDGDTHVANDLYRVSSAPTNLLIGPGGKVRYRLGQITAEELNGMLDDVLP